MRNQTIVTLQTAFYFGWFSCFYEFFKFLRTFWYLLTKLRHGLKRNTLLVRQTFLCKRSKFWCNLLRYNTVSAFRAYLTFDIYLLKCGTDRRKVHRLLPQTYQYNNALGKLKNLETQKMFLAAAVASAKKTRNRVFFFKDRPSIQSSI